MERIVSFLLFAIFFYLMMRFGCGSHMVHGHHGGNHADHPAGEQRDPVCGMPVAQDAGYSERYQNREYRFCSRRCLDKFDANPQQYARA